MKPDILIACATQKELAPFLGACTDLDQAAGCHMDVFFLNASIHQLNIGIIITGVGVVNTAHALTLAIKECAPGLIINTGIAGAFQHSGLAIGDIGVAENERYFHTGIESESVMPDPLPFDLIEGEHKSRQGVFSCSPKWRHTALEILQRAPFEFSVRTGPFLTVSTITASLDRAEQIRGPVPPVMTPPIMESMEGAAAAHIAALRGIPFLEIRSASNYAGERNKANWNIQLACEHIGVALCEFMSSV